MPKRPKGNSDAETESEIAKAGGLMLAVASLQFVLAMVAVQLFYPCGSSGCYNILTNPISDLGNTVTSPLWPLFNYSLIIFSFLFFGGLLLLFRRLSNSPVASLGFIVLAVSAFAAAGVGTFPENTILAIHSLFALTAFLGGGFGVLFIGIAQMRSNRRSAYALYSVLSGILVLMALLVFATRSFGLIAQWSYSGSGFGFGGIERIAALPTILWVLVTGIKVIRDNKG